MVKNQPLLIATKIRRSATVDMVAIAYTSLPLWPLYQEKAQDHYTTVRYGVRTGAARSYADRTDGRGGYRKNNNIRE